jgi:hypothetical protein
MGGRLSQQGYPFWLPKTGTLFGCGPKASQSILHSAIRSAGGGDEHLGAEHLISRARTKIGQRLGTSRSGAAYY